MHTRVSRSRALVHWQSVSSAEIDHLLDAHHVVRGIGPGGAPAAEQVLHALVVQLAARFQRYCRDLHDDCVDAVAAAAPASLRLIMEELLRRGRRLDRQNATSAAIDQDFSLFGILVWPAIENADPAHVRRRLVLDEVNRWRNAIAHQDFDRGGAPAALPIDLPTVRRWRADLDWLATGLDLVAHQEIRTITGSDPW